MFVLIFEKMLRQNPLKPADKEMLSLLQLKLSSHVVACFQVITFYGICIRIHVTFMSIRWQPAETALEKATLLADMIAAKSLLNAQQINDYNDFVPISVAPQGGLPRVPR